MNVRPSFILCDFMIDAMQSYAILFRFQWCLVANLCVLDSGHYSVYLQSLSTWEIASNLGIDYDKQQWHHFVYETHRLTLFYVLSFAISEMALSLKFQLNIKKIS